MHRIKYRHLNIILVYFVSIFYLKIKERFRTTLMHNNAISAIIIAFSWPCGVVVLELIWSEIKKYKIEHFVCTADDSLNNYFFPSLWQFSNSTDMNYLITSFKSLNKLIAVTYTKSKSFINLIPTRNQKRKNKNPQLNSLE